MNKISNYNHFLEHDNRIIAYNARTNALAELDKLDYLKLKNDEKNKFKNLNEDLLVALKHGGFIIDDNLDELDMVRHNIILSKFSTHQLGLTIAPTSNCNFRCPYCYEKDVLRCSSMTDHIADSIVRFVNNNANTINLLGITWYGGEPLLELKRIEKLTKEFKKICNKNNVKYQANIVTNGYLLHKETLLKLIDLDISSIQVTLDGTKEFHDQTRYLLDKKPTFDTIIQNLKDIGLVRKSCEFFPGISIRMNISRKNVSGCEKLIKYLHENQLDEYVNFYPAIVTDPCDEEYQYVYTVEEFEYIKDLVKKIKKEIDWKFPEQSQYPDLSGNNCVCDMYNSFVIDSDGEMYKCWELMGDTNNSIGNIENYSGIISNKDYYSNILEDPSKNVECMNCSILPICHGGGCPIYRNKYKFKPNCENLKKQLYAQIKETYISLINNKR